MTARGFYVLFFGAALMFTALSVSSAASFLLGAAALLACLISFLSALSAFLTLRLEQRVPLTQAQRGDSCRYSLSIRMIAPLPIAPLSLSVCLPSGRKSEFTLSTRLFGTTVSDNDFSCPHVGVFPVGVAQVTLGDCFGLFRIRRAVREALIPVTVLPYPRESPLLQYSPGEGETSAALRAQADRSTPEDTRLWQEGDELGRVHWKLSMRRQELMVHTYETPQKPDALVLLNCMLPLCEGRERAALIDALTETCAGTLKGLLEAHRITRLPLTADASRELSGQEIAALDPMLHALAQESFSRSVDFERVLLLSSRRMRRTGSTAILSAELTPRIADAVIALGRMGPHTRFTFVSSGEPSRAQQQLLHLLLSSGVETFHVRA